MSTSYQELSSDFNNQVYLPLCWWECNLVQLSWRTVQRLLKKLKANLPYDLAIAFMGIYPEKVKILIQKDTFKPMFVAAAI